jgi:anti-sigma factor RsiW
LSTVSSTSHRGLWPDDQVTCQELVELVTAYLEAVLPDEQRARFENHLAACPHCRTYLEQMQQTIRATGQLTEESIAPPAREELLRAFRRWKSG